MKRRTINALTGVVIMAALEITACQYAHQYQKMEREDITTTSIEQEETTEVETMTTEETTTENETTTVEETTTIKETTTRPTTTAEIPTTTETEIETTTIAETLPPEPVTEPPVIIEPTPRYIFSEEDATYLVKVASCEAGNQGVYGMALVMRVVLNRSLQWGMSIHDVIYQQDQFNCIYSHWWAEEYRAEGVYEALEWIKNGWDESCGATFFCTPQRNNWHMNHLQYLFQYGNAQFYKEW